MTQLAVLLGRGIGYSASPAIHNAAFAAIGIDARYELRDVELFDLGAEVEALREPDLIGANVTTPHKIAVCEMVDELQPEVQRLGAANAIVRIGHRLVAANTDLAALTAELPPDAQRAVVLGSGGGSRAAVAALTDIGCSEVLVLDRARMASLPGALATADLVINATPVGTNSEETPIPPHLLRADLRVLDLVYRPSPSRLVRDARAVGAAARGGAGMLLRQAAASFELWTGRQAPVDAMRQALESSLMTPANA